MGKTATLNLRVNPVTKEKAEEVLSMLGISMSTAIEMYLNQIALTRSIPFDIALPKSVNADLMTDEELVAKIKDSYEQAMNGQTVDAKEFFEEFKKQRGIK